MGFYTPRFVDVTDRLLAEHEALEDFRQSTIHHDLMETALNSDDDPPVVCGEDIEEVRPGTRVGLQIAGLSFYKESDE